MILKPFSHNAGIKYRDFQLQNYFILNKNLSIKKVNLKGINAISKANNDDFTDLEEKDLFVRKFDELELDQVLISRDNFKIVNDECKSRLEKENENQQNDLTFSHLSAAFSYEMFDIVWIEELMTEQHREGINIIKDTMIFGGHEKYFGIFTENLNKYDRYLQKPTEFEVLQTIKESTEENIKAYENNPFDHFLLGLIFHRPTRFRDLEKSYIEFNKSRELSEEIDNHDLIVMCDMMLSWLAYLNEDYTQAIALSQRAIDNEFLGIPELYYMLAKYYACIGDIKKMISYLDEAAMKFDKFYTIKAAIDDDFLKYDSKLKDYFKFLMEEEKKNVFTKLKHMGIIFTGQEVSMLEEEQPLNSVENESVSEIEEKNSPDGDQLEV